MSSLLNKKAVRQLLLDTAKGLKPHHPLTSVSEECYPIFESAIRRTAAELIRRHPSVGTTIKP